VKNADQFVEDPSVLCGVGHYSSRLTINLEDFYHRAHLPFISPSSTNPEVTQRHYLEISRVTGRDDVGGASIANFMHTQGWESLFIVRTQVDYASRVADGLKRAASVLGLKLLGDNVINPDATGYQTLMSRISDAAPDVVYFSGWSDAAGAFFKEARLAGYRQALFAAYGDSSLGDKAGPLAVEGGGLYYMTGTVPPRVDAGTRMFSEDFETANGRPPGLVSFGAEAYDAAGVCLKGIEAASLGKGGELPTREEVAAAIRTIQGYQGITWTFTFDGNGEPVTARYVILQATSVDPGSWDQNPIAASIELPPPK
jgi:branched-chain amino acid transport system substrate-binding protein